MIKLYKEYLLKSNIKKSYLLILLYIIKIIKIETEIFIKAVLFISTFKKLLKSIESILKINIIIAKTNIFLFINYFKII